jgi:chemotaxis methyl-accepting protein methylase
MQPDLRHVRFQGTPALSRSPAVRRRHREGSSACPSSPPEERLDGLSQEVLTRAGLDAARYRAAPLRRRVAACLRALKAGSEAEALQIVRQRPRADALALDTLLIGVSSFFRDTDVFHALREHVIPAWAQRDRPINVLSVGCSSGEEVYSVALLLAGHGLLARARLVGMDCRARAIAHARIGVYSREAFDGLDGRDHAAGVERLTTGWRMGKALRERCEWVVGDATGQLPAGAWDMVLCRNLAIYLRPSAGLCLFTCLTQALRPGGCLVLRRAERPPDALRLCNVARCVYLKP